MRTEKSPNGTVQSVSFDTVALWRLLCFCLILLFFKPQRDASIISSSMLIIVHILFPHRSLFINPTMLTFHPMFFSPFYY